MIKLTAVLACAALLAMPSRAQEEEQEAAPPAEESQAPAIEAPAAPARPAGPAFRPGAKKPAANPSSSGGGGGSGGGPGIMRDTSEVQSLGGAGMGQGDADDSPRASSARSAAGGGGGGAGGGDFSVVDLGDLPTVGQLTGRASGGGRLVAHIAGGKKWAIRVRHKGPGVGVFPWLIGGTNGDLTGNGKYTYKAAFSKNPGAVSGSGPCVGEMFNAAYVTCQPPCNMKWELRFGTPKKDRRKDTCELENDAFYYLNIEPVGPGCTGSPAQGFGCPLVMEIANGGVQLLNP